MLQVPHSTATDTQDVELSHDELHRLEECLKDRTFRDLLSEYVKEISDPRRLSEYEAYLKSVEESGEGPQNRRLMKPVASFCAKVKTKPIGTTTTATATTDTNTSKKHIFINFCSGDLVKDALLGNAPANASKSNANKSELCWQIPYVLGHRRSDASTGDIIYDIAFSAKTIALTLQEKTFKAVVIRTAIEAVNGSDTDYELLCGGNGDGNRYKILKSVQCKGNIAAPVMSVCVDSGTEPHTKATTKTGKSATPSQSQSLKQQIQKQKQKQQLSYQIIESTEKSMDSCWNDHSLLSHASLQRPKQIHVVIPFQQQQQTISSIKDLDCRLSLQNGKKPYTLHVSLKNGSNQNCSVDLKRYEIIPSSMNAVWYHNKQELRVTFDVVPPPAPSSISKAKLGPVWETKQDEEECGQVHDELELKIDDAADIEADKGGEGEFLMREVCSKRLNANMEEKENMNATFDCDHKEAENEKQSCLCHHQLPMQRVHMPDGRSHWICSKPLEQRCTAFKWDDGYNENNNKPKTTPKKPMETFEIEQREKLEKVVLLVRVMNIIASSVQVAFKETGDVDIEFETHEYRYCKHLQLESRIDVDACEFDVNDRNLLIMVAKQAAKHEINDDDVCKMLNDSVLFEID